MKRVLTAVVLIPLVVIALFKAPLWLFTLLVFGVAMLAAHEYLGIVEAQGFRPFRVICYLCLAATFAIFYWVAKPPFEDPLTGQLLSVYRVVAMATMFGLPALAAVAPLVFLLASLRRDPLSEALPDAAVSYLLLPYVGFTLVLLPALLAQWNGALFVLYLMLLIWCGDIAAYYVGRAIGKHKLAPRVSPGKSWEGAIASVVCAVAVGVLLFRFMGPITNALRGVHLLGSAGTEAASAGSSSAPLWMVVLFAVTVNVAAQLGDLVESALKRGAGVKDSGTLLPGHGGVLDRIDALLFALPVGMIFHAAGLSVYFPGS